MSLDLTEYRLAGCRWRTRSADRPPDIVVSTAASIERGERRIAPIEGALITAEGLRLSSYFREGVAIVEVEGRITFRPNAMALRDFCRTEMDRARYGIVLSLEGVQYIDSGGLGILFGLITEAAQAAKGIRWVGIPKTIAQLLLIVRTPQPWSDSLDSAIHEVTRDSEERTGTIKLSSYLKDDVTIVAVEGRLVNQANASALREYCRQLLQNTNFGIVLDLGRVPYLDSAGLGTLVGLYSTACRSYRQLILANLPERIIQILQVIKIGILPTSSNVEEAIEQVKGTKAGVR
jgi:anti-sigma B factor antagonist